MASPANVLRELLRPAVRFALRRGIKLQTFTEAIKTLLVEEAKRELVIQGEAINVSRLAVMTGLQRRDVQRVSSTSESATQHVDLMTRLVGAWCTDKQFSKGGAPRNLSCEGQESEFSQLVQSISRDLNPYTLLFELERLSLVERAGSELRLLWSSYQITGDSDDAYLLLQRDIEELIEGVDYNIRSPEGPPNLHIATRFDNVTVSALPGIRDWILKKGAEFHADIRAYVGSFDKDINPDRYAEAGGAKVTVGSFSLSLLPEKERDAK